MSETSIITFETEVDPTALGMDQISAMVQAFTTQYESGAANAGKEVSVVAEPIFVVKTGGTFTTDAPMTEAQACDAYADMPGTSTCSADITSTENTRRRRLSYSNDVDVTFEFPLTSETVFTEANSAMTWLETAAADDLVLPAGVTVDSLDTPEATLDVAVAVTVSGVDSTALAAASLSASDLETLIDYTALTTAIESATGQTIAPITKDSYSLQVEVSNAPPVSPSPVPPSPPTSPSPAPSTPSPSPPVAASPSAPAVSSPSAPANDEDDEEEEAAGAPIGGIVGGIVGALVVLGVIGFFVWRSQSKKAAAADGNFSTTTSQHV